MKTLIAFIIVTAAIILLMIMIRSIMYLFSKEKDYTFWHEYVFGDGTWPLDPVKEFFVFAGGLLGGLLFLLFVILLRSQM